MKLKTRSSRTSNITKLVLKLLIPILFVVALIYIMDRIELPTPKKDIIQELPNESFKVVK